MSVSSAVWNSLMKIGARRVHGPEADQTLADVELPCEVHDPVGQVHQLHALVGFDDERLAMDGQTADRRGGHRLQRGSRGR